MNSFSFNLDKCYYRSNSICCELVIKSKQYISVLQFESTRISSLQVECNQMLDCFYASKNEFDFLVKEALPLKYFAENNVDSMLSEEYVKEFSMFAMSIWQIGKYRFLERGKKAQYICFVGKLLSEVISTITSFVNEIMARLNYLPFHPECTSTIYNICNQIYAELQGDCLGSADACLRQYVYLQSATPFLQELKSLIYKYLSRPDINTPKEFLDRIILAIPPIENILQSGDTDDTSAFRFVVELLNGRLLDKEVLDQNSDIRPVVENDINLKRSINATKTVEWIMQQYKVHDIPMLVRNEISSDMRERRINYFTENSHHNYCKVPNFLNSSDLADAFEPFDMSKIDWVALYSNHMYSQKKTYNRRGRKNGSSNNENKTSCDLQPIKLHTLQTPLLPPLL